MIKLLGILILIGLWIWIGYELYNAPEMDDQGNIKKKK
jgi:hypothetical protein